MSSQKPTDTDHEILKLLRWVRENYNVSLWNDRPVWTKEGHGLYDDSVILHYFKEQQNAKH